MSHPHKEDIRGQLSDIQKKLFGSSKEKATAPLQLPDATQGARQPPGLTSSSSSVPRLRQKSSSSHLGKLSNSNRQNTLVPQPAPALGPESKGHDMNFVVGLSENLLTECRRLTAENNKYKTKLKGAAEELSKYKNQIVSLTNSRSFAASNEEQLRDKNWELEATVTHLNEEIEQLRITNDKLVKSTNESTLRITSIQKENDELRLQHNKLDSDLHKSRDSYEKEIAELNSRISLLNDENDLLLVKSTEKAAKGATESTPIVEKKAKFHDILISDDLDLVDLDSILTASEALPREPDSSSSNAELRVETLKANLDHAHRMVAKLRGALLKTRFENQSPLTRETPRSSKKSKQRDFFPPPSNRSSTIYSPAKRNSKFLVLDDESGDNWPQDEKWEDYIETGSATPSKSARRLESWDDDSPQKMQSDVPPLDGSESSSDSENEDMTLAKRDIRLELSNVAGLTDEQVQKYAKDNHLVLVQQDEYAKLQYNDVNDISEERLKGVTEIRGLVCLSKKEYNRLLDEEEMKLKLKERGLVTIDSQEYETITKDATSYLNPKVNYLTAALEKHGFQTIESEYLEVLKKNEELVSRPSEPYLRSKCKEAQLHTLTNDEFKTFKKLEADHLNPDKAYLTEKANELGMILTSSTFYDELVARADEPTAEQIIEHGFKKNLHVLDDEKLRSLQSPLLVDWKAKAASYNYAAIPSDEHDHLQKLAFEPTLDSLKSYVRKHDHVVVSRGDFEKLNANANQPLLSHLREKAKTQLHSVIPTEELDGLRTRIDNPSIEYIKEKATGHKIIENGQFMSLLQKAHEPSLAQVQTHAEKHDLVTMDKSEYADLYKTFSDPSFEFLKSKATSKGYQLLKSDELHRLRDIELSPSREFIASKANDMNCVVINKTELKNLEELAKNPPLERVKTFLAGFGLCAIESDQLTSLRKQLNEPTFEEVSERAKSVESILLKTSEYEEIKHAAANPSMELINTKITADGCIIVSKGEFEDLKNHSENPSLEFIKLLAARINMLVILNNDLESLRTEAESPGIETLEKHAIKHDKLLLSRTQFAELEKRAQDPSLSELREHAERANHEVLPVVEAQKLRKNLNEPSLDFIQSHASRLSHVLLSSSDHEALTETSRNPSLEKLKERAETLNYVILEAEAYKILKQDANEPSIEVLRKHAEAHSHDVIPQEEVTRMRKTIDEPELDFIQQHSSRLKHTVLPHDKYAALKTAAEEPSLTKIEKQAAALDYELVKAEDFAALKKAALEPDVQELSLHAKRRNHMLISAAEHEELNRKATTPNEEELRELAEGSDYVLTKRDMFEQLQQQLHQPAKSYLDEKASDIKCRLIAEDDFENPSTEYLVSKAAKINMRVVPEDFLNNLENLAKQPSLEHVIAQAGRLEQVVVSKSEYETLLKEAREPTPTTITSKALALGLCAIPLTEYNSLKKTSEKPDSTWIAKEAEKHGNVVIEKNTYDELITLAHQPGVDHLKKLATEKDKCLIDITDFEDVKRRAQEPTLDELKAFVIKHDGEFMRKKDAETLRKLANSPDIEFVRKHASKYDHVLLATSEYRALNTPDVLRLSELAHPFNLSLVENNELDTLRQLAHEPQIGDLSERALKHNHSVIPTQVYESILLKANNPDLDHLKSRATSLDHAVIKKSDYKRLLGLASTPDVEHVRKQATRLQLELVPKEELVSLKKFYFPDVDSLKEGISKHGMVAVPTTEFEKHLEDKERLNTMKLVTHDEYDNLLSITKNPSIEFLEENADRIDMALISKAELERLYHNDEEPDIDFLTRQAERHGYQLVADNEYHLLKENSNSPSLDFLLTKAQNAGQKVISQEQHDEMTRIVRNPSIGHLTERAAQKQMSLISNIELQKLRATYEDPGTEYLFQKAEQKSFKLLSSDEYRKLTDAIENPSLDYLKKKSQLKNQTLIETSELTEMKKNLSEPSFELLRQKALSKNHMILDSSEFHEMKQKIEDPSLENLSAHASSKGFDLVLSTDYISLKEYKAKGLESLAEEEGFKLLSTMEYEKLLDDVETPSLDKIQKVATSEGFVILKKDEHSNMLEKSESPALDHIVTKARAHKSRVISDELYDELHEPLSIKIEKAGMIALAKDEYDQLKNPSLEKIKLLPHARGFVLVPESEFTVLSRSLEAKLEDANLIGVPRTDYQRLRESAESPIFEKICEVASKQDHCVISRTEYDLLSRDLLQRAMEQGLTLIKIDDLEALKSTIDSPTAEFLKSAAISAGMIAVTKEDFTSLTERANKSLTDQAQEQSLTVLPTTEYDDLMGSRLQCEELSASLDELKRQYDEPSLEFLHHNAATKNYVLVGNSEYEKLKSHAETSIFDKAAALSMVAVLAADFKKLKSSADESIEAHASRKGLTIIKPTELAELKKKIESPSAETARAVLQSEGMTVLPTAEHDELKGRANRTIESLADEAGMILVSKDDHERNMKQFSEPSEHFIKTNAATLGFCCIENSEFESLKKDASLSAAEKAEISGLAIIAMDELKDLRARPTIRSIDDLQEIAEAHDSIVVSKAELDDWKARANRSIEEQVEGTGKLLIASQEYDALLLKANKPSFELLTMHAGKKGLTLLPSDELEELKTKSAETLEERAEKQGVALIEQPRLKAMEESLKNPQKDELISRCNILGLSVIEVNELEELRKRAKFDFAGRIEAEGKVIIPKDEISQLKEAANKSVTPEEAKAVLLNGGFKVFTEDEFTRELSSKIPLPLGFGEMISALEKEGYSVSKADEEFRDANDSFALDVTELKCSADKLNKIVVDREEYERMLKTSEQLNDKDLFTKAGAVLGLSVLSSGEFLKFKQSLAEKDSRIHELSRKADTQMSKEDLARELDKHGLVVIRQDEYATLKDKLANLEASQENIMTEEEISKRASDLGLSVVSATELHKMKRSLMIESDAGQLRQAAKNLGMICVPLSAAASNAIDTDAESGSVKLLPISEYNSLRDSNIDTISDEKFKTYAEKRGFKHESMFPVLPVNDDIQEMSEISPSSRRTTRGVPQSRSVGSNLTIHSRASMLDSITGMSVASNISLTDKSMIPVITQVLIGEYLFKYYRKLGPLSSISSTRHERYFWVHPYSLTLYWSNSNPVLKNPNASKSKAIAILGVESVEDNNPIPVGLYHKSIIVHSQTKSVKFTCSNRQRHNIWYNSLRYLVHRNINELDFGGRHHNKKDSPEADHSDEDEDDGDELPDMTFDASNRQALPRSSTILRSSSLGRFMSLKR